MRAAVAVALVCACGGKPTPAPTNISKTVEIRPLLVLVGSGELDSAYLLACAKLETGKPAMFLDGKACAPLLDKVDVDLITANGRVPVTLGAKGEEMNCLVGESSDKRPVVKIVGLPQERAFVVVGRAVTGKSEAPAAPVMETIRKVRPLRGLKGPRESGPNPVGQFDLDGDGVFEILMSLGGMEYELLTPTGKSIGRVGCYFG